MMDKNKAYVEAIELLTQIALLLLNRNTGVCEEDSLSIEQVAEILDVPVGLVRSVFVELSSNRGREDKGGFGLYLAEDDLDYDGSLFDELDDMLDSHKNIREKAFKTGDLDQKGFYTMLNGYEGAYIMLTAKEYNVLRKFLNEKYMSSDIIHMDEEDLYNVIPTYNDDSEVDISIERKILDAIRKGYDVDIKYDAKDRQGLYTIKPLKIIRYSLYGVSYVLTIVDGELSPFRIDCIKRLVENKKSHIKIDDLRPLEKLPYVWGMDLKSGEGDVVLKVYNHNDGKVLDKVKRDIAYYVQHAGYEVEQLDSGDIIVKGHVIGKSSFLNWVRSYGASMVILEPTSWGEDIIASALRKLNNYK